MASKHAWVLAIGFAALGTTAGCADNAGPVADGGECVPGMSEACTCANGSMGAQTCAPDGAGFDECVCDGGETGDSDASTGDGDGDTTTGDGDGDTTTGDGDGDTTTGDGDGDPTTGDGDGDCQPGFSVEDDFERAQLGGDWGIVFPPNGTQVQIIDSSDLGMGPGPQGFFLANWRADVFEADQFCEASIPLDVTDGWAHQVYVRWRENDGARYGFGYNNDPNQEFFGMWYFKYDGVPSQDTRVFATEPANEIPVPGDVLRVEVEGYTLRGYLNGELMLEATDTDPTKIAAGEVGLAARWANGNQQTNNDVKVWEWWSGGNLCE